MNTSKSLSPPIIYYFDRISNYSALIFIHGSVTHRLCTTHSAAREEKVIQRAAPFNPPLSATVSLLKPPSFLPVKSLNLVRNLCRVPIWVNSKELT